jgi:hypothetical protein
MSTGTGKRHGPGRPPDCPHERATYIVELHRQGLNLARICEVLNRADIPTPSGGPRWTKSHVDRLLHTRYAQDIRNELDNRSAWFS